jgi:alpha-tubulin suppressor-like RCC1 family protein
MRNALSPAARLPLLLLLAAAACRDAAGTAGGGDAAATGLTPVVAVPATLPIRTPVQLVVVVTDSNGVAVKGATVHWTVGEASGSVAPAASVSDGDGHASAVWTLGTKAADQTVRAALDSAHTRSWTVHVSPGAAVSVVITPDSVQVPSLEMEVPLHAAAVDSFGNAVPSTWTSLDPDVVYAAFYAPGDQRLFARYNGRARVVASAGTHADTAVVRVQQVVAKVEVVPDSVDVGAGSTFPLRVTARDARGNEFYYAPIAWTSTDPSVATVSDSGKVTGVSGGTAEVIASSGGFADSTWVTVRAPVRLGRPAAGPRSTCALSDAGTAYCWGGREFDYSGVSHPVPVSAPAPLAGVWRGDAHACGLSAAGAAYCWGTGTLGQLGTGSTPDLQPGAAPVSGSIVFTALAVGYRHSCGIDASGAAWCWGSNDHGQLGVGTRVVCGGVTTECAAVPTRVAGGHTFTAIDAFWHRTCAVEAGGDVYCWGEGFGAAPVLTMTGRAYDHVAVGQEHVCALSAGAAWCQGVNSYGQLGSGSSSSSTVPVAVAGGLSFTTIDAGLYFTCALTADQHAWCWGRNGDGELGNTAGGDGTLVPIAVAGGHLFARLASGGAHTCAEAPDGLWCWGGNSDGQLGDATLTGRRSPVRVTPQP